MQVLLVSFWLRAGFLGAVLIYLSFTDSSTHDEPAHFACGIYDWQVGSFDLYYVNPPLTRMIAALPASFVFDSDSFADPSTLHAFTNWGGGADSHLWRDHGLSAEHWLAIGRCLLIPVMLLGLWSTEQFALELYGPSAGVFSGWLYVLCPSILAIGHSVAADGTCTAMLVVACYTFYRWLHEPKWQHCVMAGWILGLAMLTKTVIILVPILFTFAWLIANAFNYGFPSIRRAGQLIAMFALSLLMLNAAYGFRGSFTLLRDYEFISDALSGAPKAAFAELGSSNDHATFALRNRFRNGWLGQVPVPLPQPYIYGIDRQKRDFEIPIPTFILGEWREGRWYDQLVAALIKLPLGIVALFLLAIFYRLRCLSTEPVNESPTILLTFAGLLAMNLYYHNITIFFRYMAPCLPLAFIWISALVRSHHNNQCMPACSGSPVFAVRKATPSLWNRLSWILLISSGASVVYSLPHATAYCNYFCGGPWQGSEWYIGTNEYGQNLWRLKSALDRLPSIEPIYVCEPYFQKLSDTFPGPYGRIPSKTMLASVKGKAASTQAVPAGWYVATQYDINPPESSHGCSWLSQFKPVSSIAPGLFLYHLSCEDVQSLH